MKTICKFNCVLLALCSLLLQADPTRPDQAMVTQSATAPTQVSRLPQLSLIRSQGQQHQALIDGTMVRQGDTVGSFRVKTITAKQVVLQQNDQLLVLHLLKTTAK